MEIDLKIDIREPAYLRITPVLIRGQEVGVINNILGHVEDTVFACRIGVHKDMEEFIKIII